MTTVSTARDRRITRALRIIAALTVIAMIATIAGLGLVWVRVHNTRQAPRNRQRWHRTSTRYGGRPLRNRT